MAGYELNEGSYDKRNASDDELWSALSCVFSSRSKNNSSYKYGFLKAIIDNLYNTDSELKLTFDQVFSKFSEIYWNLVLRHGLKQRIPDKNNNLSQIEQVLFAAQKKYQISENISFENLTSTMMIDVCHQVKQKCKKYVVGALYEDTNKLFYSFSKRGEWIQINPVMYDFICRHKVLIEKLNYYEWARFLEKVNEDTVSVKILNKIDASDKRTNLSYYRHILFEEFESKNCFYCGRRLNPNKIDVDHFIPWSFIKDDNLWNLVLSCPECNRRKKDRLPEIRYISSLAERNRQLVIEYKRPEMSGYHERMITYVYNWAKVNGYLSTWRPTYQGSNSN